MRFRYLSLAALLFAAIACHPGPVINKGSQPSVGGTIAGIVSTDANTRLAGRKVTATNTATGVRYDATTGENGGYTIKVPEGTYRLEVELRAGEIVAKQPPETHIDNSDLDPKRDFVISVKRAGG